MKKAFFSVLTFILATSAFAQGPGPQRTHIANHPRVNQVNGRMDNQENRISNQRKDGDISRAQAHHDRRDLTKINQEKRNMRNQNNGHLTKSDDRTLNRQLNRNSRKIGN